MKSPPGNVWRQMGGSSDMNRSLFEIIETAFSLIQPIYCNTSTQTLIWKRNLFLKSESYSDFCGSIFQVSAGNYTNRNRTYRTNKNASAGNCRICTERVEQTKWWRGVNIPKTQDEYRCWGGQAGDHQVVPVFAEQVPDHRKQCQAEREARVKNEDHIPSAVWMTDLRRHYQAGQKKAVDSHTCRMYSNRARTQQCETFLKQVDSCYTWSSGWFLLHVVFRLILATRGLATRGLQAARSRAARNSLLESKHSLCPVCELLPCRMPWWVKHCRAACKPHFCNM